MKKMFALAAALSVLAVASVPASAGMYDSRPSAAGSFDITVVPAGIPVDQSVKADVAAAQWDLSGGSIVVNGTKYTSTSYATGGTGINRAAIALDQRVKHQTAGYIYVSGP